ncbi:acyl-CoA thioesterase [Gelidibacter salicanalis]|uniref:Acyl-CoA thioesterase 2 n=1 Tax=Gelidibacter salicanalis TaxID=291193 RepID=A0A934KRG4_9FLAO|nr:acyl-CoA thioesterase II [Gelidibacter salicanalis]MBJ7882174.1 acyl-CoA thioesterase II [Gelidibacter salicanalis]
MTDVTDLIELIALKEIHPAQFEGFSKTVGSPNVFGGQVLAQALNAAARTISNKRVLHSMHSYFLEAGDLELPIIYTVNITRDGGSFSVRRVTAEQNDVTIFILSASFQNQEEGHNHQISMAEGIKQPEELMGWSEILEQFGEVIPKKMKSFLEVDRPVEFKPVELVNPFNSEDLPAFTNVWFKLKGDASHLDLALKQQILTYVSDYNILAAAMNRHASKAHWGNTQTASLDHSMWYFRDFDFDDWMLYSMESPNASGARGFAKGNIFTRDGKLVASVAQEGLMRPKN